MSKILRKSLKRRFIYIELKLNRNSDIQKITSVLETTFGIENFSFCNTVRTDIKKIKKKALEIVSSKEGTFKVKTNRADKEFPIKSPNFNKQLGLELEKEGAEASIKNPDYYLTIFRKLLINCC